MNVNDWVHYNNCDKCRTEERSNLRELNEGTTRTNERLNTNVEAINRVNQRSDGLVGNINDLVEAINKLQIRCQKLEKENKIFKSTLWLYSVLFESMNPVAYPLEKMTGNLQQGENRRILWDAIKSKWKYFPGQDFGSSSVSNYNGYDDSDV